MPDLGLKVVTLARGWIGTPYCHQASAKGMGCDCLGLLRGVYRDLKGAEPQGIPPYSADWCETSGTEALWQALARHLAPVSGSARPGQVLLFRMRRGSMAKHLGIQSQTGPAPRFIHAYCGHGVVESPLSAPWARRVVARFTLT